MKKSLNIDIFVSPEIGFCIVIGALILIFIGYKNSKKEIDINNIPWFKPLTLVIIGSFLLIFGLIQLLPLIKLII